MAHPPLFRQPWGTTLRAYTENQSSFGRRPNFRTVQDNVSAWLSAYNQYAPQLTPAQVEAAFYWNPSIRNTVTGTAPSSVITLANGSRVDLGLIRRDFDTLAQSTALIYSGNGQWTEPLGNQVTLLGTRLNTGTGANANPHAKFIRSGDPRENTVGFLDAQVTNKGIFPYETVEIGALPGNYRWEKDRKMYVNLEQRITPDLYLSATFQKEYRTAEQYFATISQTNQISIDINTHLPDGRANPNFLRPFIYGRNLGEFLDQSAENIVLQANYDLDFTKKTKSLGWLGTHRITALHTRSKLDRFRYQYHYQFKDNIPGVLPDTILGTNPPRWTMQVWYVGDPVKVGDTALRFTGFPSTLAAHQDRSYNYTYFDGATGTWRQSPAPISTGRYLVTNGRTYTINKNTGTGLSMQSYFWKKKIITLFGLREDKVDNLQLSLPTTVVVDPFPTLLGRTRADYLPTGARYLYKDRTATQSVVFKATEWLRPFAVRSENFAAQSQRQDNLFRPVAPQNGSTTEYGVGLTFFGEKLNLRLYRFDSAQALAQTNVYGQVPNNRIFAFEDRLYNAILAAGRNSEWNVIGEFGRVGNFRYATPNGNTTTESRKSTGTSLEINYAPARNCDLILSFDQIDNKITAIGPELADYFAFRADFYRKWFDTNILTNGALTAVQDFTANVAAEYAAGSAFLGTSNRGVSKYTSTAVGRYSFTSGPIKGVTIGTSLRWGSGMIIGYRLKPATLNFGGLTNYPGQIYDISAPFKDKAQLSGGMHVNYRRKIFGDRVGWRIQLNVQNLYGKQGLRVIGANADGSSVWGMAPARAFELSNNFDF